MKKNIIICLTFIAIIFSLSSCIFTQSSNYKPLRDYNGRVSKITEYRFYGDMDKALMISKVGRQIPDRIIKYNKSGDEVFKLVTYAPEFDEEESTWSVSVEICSYNKHGDNTEKLIYNLYLDNSEISSFVDSLIYDNYSHVYSRQLNNYSYSKGKITRIETTNETSIHRSDKGKVNIELENTHFYLECSKIDTTIIQKEYEDGLCVKEITYSGVDVSTHTMNYENGVLVEETILSNSDTTEYKYRYDNGLLIEKTFHGGKIVYDNKGREIYFNNGYRETIKSYDNKGNHITNTKFNNSNSVSLNMTDINGRDSLFLYVFFDEDFLSNRIIRLFESVKINQISVTEFEDKMADDMKRYEIDLNESFYEYEKYDGHGNVLFESKREKTLKRLGKPSYYYTPKLYDFYFNSFVEREFEYYK